MNRVLSSARPDEGRFCGGAHRSTAVTRGAPTPFVSRQFDFRAHVTSIIGPAPYGTVAFYRRRLLF